MHPQILISPNVNTEGDICPIVKGFFARLINAEKIKLIFGDGSLMVLMGCS